MIKTRKEVEVESSDEKGASRGAEPAKGADAPDPDCICHGNWRAIVKETQHLLDRRFRDRQGKVWSFYGIVHGSDDYYYGMWRPGENLLSSCVGSLESSFDLILKGENADYGHTEQKMTNDELTGAIKEAFMMARGTSSSEGSHNMAEQHYNALLAVQLARAKAS